MDRVCDRHYGRRDGTRQSTADLRHRVGILVQREELAYDNADETSNNLTQNGIAGLGKGRFDGGEFQDSSSTL